MSSRSQSSTRDELKGLIRKASVQRRTATWKPSPNSFLDGSESGIDETCVDVRVDVVWRPELVSRNPDHDASIDHAVSDAASSLAASTQHMDAKGQNINVVNSGPAVIVRRKDIREFLESASSTTSNVVHGDRMDAMFNPCRSPSPVPEEGGGMCSGSPINLGHAPAAWNRDDSPGTKSNRGWDAVMRQPLAAQPQAEPLRRGESSESPVLQVVITDLAETQKPKEFPKKAWAKNRSVWASTACLQVHEPLTQAEHAGLVRRNSMSDAGKAGQGQAEPLSMQLEPSPIVRAMRQRAAVEEAKQGNLHKALLLRNQTSYGRASGLTDFLRTDSIQVTPTASNTSAACSFDSAIAKVESATQQQAAARSVRELPAYLQSLRKVQASSIASAFKLLRVRLDTPLIEVMRLLYKSQTVIVDGWKDDMGEVAHDLVWSRAAFLEFATRAESLLLPVSSIVNDVPLVPTVRSTETLDEVWKCMVVMGSDQVGTLAEDGQVTGALLFEDLYRHILSEAEKYIPKSKNFNSHATRMFLHLSTASINDIGVSAAREAMSQSRGITRMQRMARQWLESSLTQALTMLLVCLDLFCFICALSVPTRFGALSTFPLGDPLVSVLGTILYAFAFEAGVRIFAYRLSLLDGSRIIDVFDLATVICAISVFIGWTILPSSDKNSSWNVGIVTLLLLLRSVRVVGLADKMRKIVGKNKRRYTQNGFDLDLTYMTPSMIAMSLPSVGTEANFRNPIEEVVRFFQTRHAGRYMIFNLCCERSYDASIFEGRVVRIEVEDHNPPTIDQLLMFVERVSSFMEMDKNNVVAVHCKGGKGRTGVAVCTWLLYSTFVTTANKALSYFAKHRTGSAASSVQGVSGASQRRYVHYMESIFERGGLHIRRLTLEKIVMYTCPKMDRDGGCDPWFTIEEGGREVFDWRAQHEIVNMHREEQMRVFDICPTSSLSESVDSPSKGLELVGDVRITFYDHDTLPPREELCFYLWFHTGFVDGNTLVMEKEDIDIACADTNCKIFKEHFRLVFFFSDIHSGTVWRNFPKPSFRVVESARVYREEQARLAPPGGGFSNVISRSTSGANRTGSHFVWKNGSHEVKGNHVPWANDGGQ